MNFDIITHNKKTVFIILIGVLTLISGIYFLFFNTYSVSGKIIDLANKKGVADIEISIDDIITITNEEGMFEIGNIKKYQSNILTIKTPTDYEKVTPITLKFSKNNFQNIEITPTLETIVSRVNDAIRNTQHDYLWDYMHIDDQEYWESKEKYTMTFKKIHEIFKEAGTLSAPVGTIGKNIRKLDIWQHEITEKEYTGVMEVPIETKINENKSEINLTYYQKIDGVWRYFTASNKEQHQEIINEYEEWKKLFLN